VTEHNKNEKIANLNEKLSVLKAQEDTLTSEAQRFAVMRDDLNEQVRGLRDEALGLRSQRDKLNEKVKELKQKRNEIRVGIQDKLEETKKLREESRILSKRKPPRSHEILQKEVESIDWTIQTTSLTLQEDKELVEKVKQLEMQLSIHRKLEQLAKRKAELRTEAKTMKAEAEQLHTQLTENVQKSQETHRKMLEKAKKLGTLKAEADNMHKQFLQAKIATEPINEEMKVVLSQIRQLKAEMTEEAQKERKEIEDALRESLETKAREKLKRGEKLTWEEFQLLAEKGITEQG